MRTVTIALCVLVQISCQRGDDRRALASRVSSQSQLIGGPKALGQIGDYLIENDKIRVIIHGPGENRANTLFPGSVIDVDLRRPQGGDGRGNDQMGEITPAFLFEAFNPTSFVVSNDGSNGGAAVITVEGTGGDLLNQVALLNTGILFPPALRFRIDYVLEPGAHHLTMVTTIINDSESPHPLPFLDPPDLRDLGLDIPGLEDLQLSVPLGHFVLFGAENDVFATGAAGFNVRFAIEDSYLSHGGLPAFPGIVTDYVATRADGVSYGLAVAPNPDNYPNAFADLYPGQKVTDHSLLAPFLFSAVIALYSSNPPSILLPAQEFSYTTYLVVGRGDVGSVTDRIFADIHQVATGTFAGRVFDRLTKQPVNDASVVVQDSTGNLISQFDSDTGGAFRGELPPGDYTYRITSEARFPTAPASFQVREGSITSVLEELDPPGMVAVAVTDDLGRPVPCKLTMVGRYDGADQGRDPRDFLYDFRIGEHQRPTTFDAARNEFIEAAWYAKDGRFLRRIRPGTYDLVVSRGMEYDLHTETVVVDSGGHIQRSVRLRRGVETDGWVAIDTHIHSAGSTDSGMPLDKRVISIAGEGIEMAVATDHNYVTDYQPEIGRQNLQQWLTSVVGLELTTFEMGHFNAFPLRHDSSVTRGGSFEWVGRTPQQLFDGMRALGETPEEVLIQVNHPRWDFLGYFNVFNLSQETGGPEQRTGLRSVFAPAGDEFALENFSLDFDAVEIINGKRIDLFHTFRSPEVPPEPPVPDPIPPPGEVVRNADGSIAFPGAMEDWFVLLNRGHRFAGVGASDSHSALGHEPGFPRTMVFVGEGKDGNGQYTTAEVVEALRAGRAVISMGAFVEISVNGEPIGSDVSDSDGSVEITIRAQAPDWAPLEKVTVWSNGVAVLELDIPASQAHDFTATEIVSADTDAWFLAEATGSRNLFPVVPPKEYASLSPSTIITALGSGFDLSGLDPFGNLRPSQTFAVFPLAVTNPIWVDADGNGQFDPSNASGIGTTTGGAPHEVDVRAMFEAFPATEVSP
jgi:hypothetical protein